MCVRAVVLAVDLEIFVSKKFRLRLFRTKKFRGLAVYTRKEYPQNAALQKIILRI